MKKLLFTFCIILSSTVLFAQPKYNLPTQTQYVGNTGLAIVSASGSTVSKTNPAGALEYLRTNAANNAFEWVTMVDPVYEPDYVEDTPFASGDTGKFILAVRNDSYAVTTSTDGDYSQVSVNNKGAVLIATGSGETIPVTGTFYQATQPVSIAGTVSVSGTFFQATQPVSGPLTDAELRATPVPVSGTITATPSGTQDVDVTANSIGLSTAAKQDLLLTELQLKADLTETQPVSVASLPLPPDAATETTLQGVQGSLTTIENTVSGIGNPIGVRVMLAGGSDGTDARALKTDVNGELQVDILTMPPITATNLDIRDLTFASDKVDASGSSVSVSSSALPTGAATSALQTQPGVDIGDVTVNNGAGASAVNIQDGGNSITVDGTVAITSATLATEATLNDVKTSVQLLDNAISGSEMQVDVVAPLPAGTNNIGDVDVLTLPAITIAAAQTLANVTTVGAVTAITNDLPAGNNNIGDVDIASVPAITKGTQGSTGFTVQDLKDAGRNVTNYFMLAPIITTNAEVMQSLTGYKSGAAVVATATPAVVTTGKIYRIIGMTLTYFNVATVGSARFTIRVNTVGVAVIGSPLVISRQVGISGDGASTAGHVTTVSIDFPDGLELAAGSGIAVGMQGFGVVPTTGTVVGYGKIEIFGYEY